MSIRQFAVFIVGILLMGSFFNCQDQSKNLSEVNRAAVIRLVDEVWNKGNMDVIDEILSPDYKLHIAVRGVRTDRDGYHQAVSMYRQAFPDFHFAIDDMIATGDKVVIRSTMTGTHENPFMNAPATNKKITYTAIAIRRFEQGKIVEEWVESDMLGLMQQLNLVQMPAPPQ